MDVEMILNGYKGKEDVLFNAYEESAENYIDVVEGKVLKYGAFHTPDITEKKLHAVQVAGNVIEVIYKRRELAREKEKEKEKEEGKALMGVFSHIYMSSGYAKINSAMRNNTSIGLTKDEVIRSIKTVQGDNVFKGQKDVEWDIGYETGLLNRNIDKIKRATYAEENANDTGKMKVYYRGQDLPDKFVIKYNEAAKMGTVFYSPSFLSTSTQESVAERFAKPSTDNKGVLFKITGFSATFIRSQFAPDNEKGEYIFSPHASFVVERAGKSPTDANKRWVIMKEVSNEDNKERVPMYY